MDRCHLLLGRPWQYDKRVVYDGYKNTYSFSKDRQRVVLAHLKPMLSLDSKKKESTVLLNKVEIEKEMKNGSDVLTLVVVEENKENNEPTSIVQLVLMC